MPRLLSRVILVGLALAHLSWGLWAYLAPAHFYAHFPGFGHRWTSAYPPFNEHLVADLGATFLTLGMLLAIAAWLLETRITRVVLAGVILFSFLHLVFHALHQGELAGLDLSASLTTLVLGVVIPGVLLVLPPRSRG